MKYMLFYNESCSPKIKRFESQAEAELWAGRFLLKHQDNQADNWVDMLVKGCLEKRYSKWARELS